MILNLQLGINFSNYLLVGDRVVLNKTEKYLSHFDNNLYFKLNLVLGSLLIYISVN